MALVLALVAAPPQPSLPERFDRARVVGAPVLDGELAPEEGLYVWLEDGQFRLSFVAPGNARSGRRKYQAELSATGPISAEKKGGIELDKGGSGTLYATGVVEPKERRIEAAVKSEDLTIAAVSGPKGRVPIFVGPTAVRAGKTVTIGSFSPYGPGKGP